MNDDVIHMTERHAQCVHTHPLLCDLFLDGLQVRRQRSFQWDISFTVHFVSWPMQCMIFNAIRGNEAFRNPRPLSEMRFHCIFLFDTTSPNSLELKPQLHSAFCINISMRLVAFWTYDVYICWTNGVAAHIVYKKTAIAIECTVSQSTDD